MRKLVRKLLNALGLGGIVDLSIAGMLKEAGWFKSFKTKKSVNASGDAIPWWTYSFIHFIEPRLSKDLTVFEYGSGNSTRWVASKVSKITAVEHNQDWINEVRTQLPDNAELLFAPESDYAKSVLETGNEYDAIIIDGIERNDCANCASEALTEGGVIIYDNSDRDEYKKSYDMLIKKGFKRLDFYGIGPIVCIATCTSIFYRENNCLGI